MSDLESVISASIAGLGDGDISGQAATGSDGSGDGGDDTGGSGDAVAVNAETDGTGDADAEAVVAAAEGDGSDDAGADDSADDDNADVDPFAKEHGLTEPKEGQRENRLPYHRVKAITQNAQKKTFEALTGEKLGANETLEQGIARFGESLQTYRASSERLQSYDKVEQVMLNDPARFLQLLPAVNPQYKELLAPKAAPAQSNELGPEPQPDVDLGNGKTTFSPEGLRAWMKWQTANDRIELEQKLRSEYEEKLKPLTEEQQARERYTSTVQGVQRLQEEAMEQWPGFKENMDGILAALQADKRKLYPHQALLSAYFSVVIPKYKGDRESMRKEILNELKKAPPATSVKGGKAAGNKNVAPEQQQGGDAVESAIFSAIKNLPGRS